jgi:DNA modification methylase
MATTTVATSQQSTFTNQILHSDCIDVMKLMPANSVDFILTDPPYLVNYRDRSGRTIQNDVDETWLKPAMAEAYRVLKQDRVAVMFYGWTKIDAFFEAWRSAGFQPVGHIVFRKSYSSKSRFLRYQHEQAFLLAKGRPPLPKQPLGDVMDMPYSGNKLHPTQKPVPTLAQLIRSFSLPGESVLDPFAGSGSTCAASLLTGRKYIGVEMDDVYFQQASERLQRVHQRVAARRSSGSGIPTRVGCYPHATRASKQAVALSRNDRGLDPRHARGFFAHHGGNAMICACAAR